MSVPLSHTSDVGQLEQTANTGPSAGCLGPTSNFFNIQQNANPAGVAVTSGVVPPGMSLYFCSAGLGSVWIIGTPTTAGVYDYVVNVPSAGTDFACHHTVRAAISVDAGPDQLLVSSTFPKITALAGVVSGSATKLWTVDSKPTGSTVIFTDDTNPTTNVSFSKVGVYILRLTGTTTTPSYSLYDTVTITIVPPSIGSISTPGFPPYGPPYPIPGPSFDGYSPDFRCLLSTGFNLLAVCNEPTATFLWTKISGPGDVTFSAPTSLASHVNFSKNGIYQLRLTGTVAGSIFWDNIILTVLNLGALPGIDPVL